MEAARVADRLRGLGPARLTRDDGAERLPGAPGVEQLAVAERADHSPSGLAHEVSQRLADLAADAAGRGRRTVPRLAAHAAGDQVAVLTQDLLADGDEAALAIALAELTALRRAL